MQNKEEKDAQSALEKLKELIPLRSVLVDYEIQDGGLVSKAEFTI